MSTLDASGFLLLAEGHLVKARQKLDQESLLLLPLCSRGENWESRFGAADKAISEITYAINATRHALELLK